MTVDHARTLLWGHGISCHVCLLRPPSVGTVTLNSSNPLDPPLINPNFLSKNEDMKKMLQGYNDMLAILNEEPLSKYTRIPIYTIPDLRDT